METAAVRYSRPLLDARAYRPELAVTNPIAFFKVVEQSCRPAIPTSFPSAARLVLPPLLGLPGLLPGGASWEHRKAYLSAFATCIKVGIIAAIGGKRRESGLGAGDSGIREAQGGLGVRVEGQGRSRGASTRMLLRQASYMLSFFKSKAVSTGMQETEEGNSALRQDPKLEWLDSLRSVQLVAFLWAARALTVAAKLMLLGGGRKALQQVT